MKVLVKFSDLRKLKDDNKFAVSEIKKLEDKIMKTNKELRDKESGILELSNRICNLQDLSIENKDTAEEIKLLTEENNALIEENNKLKTYAERKQPKFWFGDKVQIKADTDEVFIIGDILFKNNRFLFADVSGDYSFYEENELELINENISK